MVKDTHQPRLIYSLLRNLIRATPFLDMLLLAYARANRVRRAAVTIKQGNFFPENHVEILSDYAYSIQVSHRGVMQIINLESVLRYVEDAQIPGAFVETGTYTGGASAYALLALQRLRINKPPRDYWRFDSFEGMPGASVEDGDHGSIWITGRRIKDLGKSELGILQGHEANKADHDRCLAYLLNTGYPAQHINLIKGWFQATLKPNKARIGQIAILRMDGDFYDSTKVVFEELYDQVSEGGVVIVDDFGSFQGCRRATEEFLASRKIHVHLVYVENGIRYFIKPYISCT